FSVASASRECCTGATGGAGVHGGGASLRSGMRLTLPCAVLEFAKPLVRFRPPVSEKLPHIPHLADPVEVQLRRDQLGLVAACLRQELAPWIAEIALPVELPDVPR